MADGQWSPGRVAGEAYASPPVLDVTEPARQRRLTVLPRLLLLLPHYVVLFFLHIAAVLTVIAGWFGALVLGRLPQPVFRYLAAYLGYRTRVAASEMLLVDRYPPFSLTPPSGHPVRVEVRPTDLNRLAVLFRLPLMIPAAVVQSLALSGWWALSVLWWLITLVLGRMPRPLMEATGAVLRYQVRFAAYALMLTPAYPKELFGDDGLPVTEPLSRSLTRPLVMSGAGKLLLALFLLLGIAGCVTASVRAPDEGGSYDYGLHGTPPSAPVQPLA
ncbi:DUF4389 domain-containing protein [Streptomyces halstedii]|uniref:DUF4389 domain-containing protein n=1 Tax=Streptomyces halstedii TaxID=1944 RepID=UPI0036C4CAD0